MTKLSTLFISLTILICAGCAFTSSDVAVVRNGSLSDYPSTTVGKAFEGTFQNAKWTSFETAKGRTVVQFDGTIKLPEMEAMFGCGSECRKQYELSNVPPPEFGCGSECQKQLEEVRTGCIVSEHLSDKFAALTQSDKERDEVYKRSRHGLEEKQGDIHLQLDKLDQQVKTLSHQLVELQTGASPVRHGHSRFDNPGVTIGSGAAVAAQRTKVDDVNAQFKMIAELKTPLYQENRNLTNQIGDLETQYKEQVRSARQEKQQMEAVIGKCVESRRVDLVVHVSYQFTLSADKQTFKITGTNLALNGDYGLPGIYHDQ